MTGKRIADKLARVWRKSGEKLFVVLHGEVQGPPVADFNQRMFTYNYRIKDRYNAPVVSLGVVTAATRNTTLGRFETALWGCRTVFDFPVVRMSDWRGREAELDASRNPFAMVVRVHLALPRAEKSLQGKYNLKRDLMRRLLRRLLQYGVSAEYIRSLLRFLDWVIRLPEGVRGQVEPRNGRIFGGKENAIRHKLGTKGDCNRSQARGSVGAGGFIAATAKP